MADKASNSVAASTGPPATARRRRVEVTMEDYKKGVRNSSVRCAVAHAIRRAIPEAEKIMVDLQTIRFTLNEERLSWLTPVLAQEAITYFDAGEWSKLEPFDFFLRRDKAHQIARRVHATTKDRKRDLGAQKDHRAKGGRGDRTGVKRKTTGGKATVRRTIGGSGRLYGARKIMINQYRERDGLLAQEVELVPNGD